MGRYSTYFSGWCCEGPENSLEINRLRYAQGATQSWGPGRCQESTTLGRQP